MLYGLDSAKKCDFIDSLLSIIISHVVLVKLLPPDVIRKFSSYRADNPNGITDRFSCFRTGDGSRRRVSLYFTIGAPLPLLTGDLDSYLIHGSLGPPNTQPIWHFDRFSHFSRAH